MTKKKSAPLSPEEIQLDKKESLLEKRRRILELEAEIEEAEGQNNSPIPSGPSDSSSDGFPFDYDNPKIQEIIDTCSSLGTFAVFQTNGGRESKVGQFPLSDWPQRMESIAHECGGGTFKISFRLQNGRAAGQITQTFDPKFYGEKKVEAPKNQNMDMVALMNMMIANMNQSKNDMMELMKTFIMTQGNKSPLISSAQDLAILMPLFKQKDTDASQLVSILETGIEIGKSVSGETAQSGDSLTAKILTKLVDGLGKPVVEAVAKAALNSQAPAIPPRPKIDAPVKDVSVEEKPLLETQEKTDMTEKPAAPAVEIPPEIQKIKNSMFYKLYAPSILSAARRNESTEDWAKKILDRVPESYDGIVFDIVSREDVLDFLALYEPSVKLYSEWFLDVSSRIAKQFEVPADSPAQVDSELVPSGATPSGNGDGTKTEVTS